MPDLLALGHDMTLPFGGWPRSRGVGAAAGAPDRAAPWDMAGHAWDMVVVGRRDPTRLVADLPGAGAGMARELRASLVADMESVDHALSLRAEAFADRACRWSATRDTLPDAAALLGGMASLARSRASEAVASLLRAPSVPADAALASGLCAEAEEAWRVLERLEASGTGIRPGLATEIRLASAAAAAKLEEIRLGLGPLYAATSAAIPSRGVVTATARARAEEDLSDMGGDRRALGDCGAVLKGLRGGYAGDVVADSFRDGRHPIADQVAMEMAGRAAAVLRAYADTFNRAGFGAWLGQAAALLERMHGYQDAGMHRYRGAAELRDGLGDALLRADMPHPGIGTVP